MDYERNIYGISYDPRNDRFYAGGFNASAYSGSANLLMNHFLGIVAVFYDVNATFG